MREANYNIIWQAIDYHRRHLKERPSINDIAAAAVVSVLQLRNAFAQWAGAEPTEFLDYVSRGVKNTLLPAKRQLTLFSDAGSPHIENNVCIEQMSKPIPGTRSKAFHWVEIERMAEDEKLAIDFSFDVSPFGKILIASTFRGICYLAFIEDEVKAVEHLKSTFPDGVFAQATSRPQQNAVSLFNINSSAFPKVKLHVKGTDFQVNVWEKLIEIPVGELTTYGSLARELVNIKAARAVGSAVGSNPIAFLIPCHRVIQSNGKFDGYRWGNTRKAAIIGWENFAFRWDNRDVDFF